MGASVAGLATAEALRRKGYSGSLTVLGAETHPPYDRPPLSKQVLAGVWEPQRTRLRTARHSTRWMSSSCSATPRSPWTLARVRSEPPPRAR